MFSLLLHVLHTLPSALLMELIVHLPVYSCMYYSTEHSHTHTHIIIHVHSHPKQSVVLVTRLPYVTFFSQVIQKIAPEYFTNGIPSLEAGNYPPPPPPQRNTHKKYTHTYMYMIVQDLV